MAMGSSFGDLFRISTFGESHGGGVGVIVEGCPPRLNLNVASIQFGLNRFDAEVEPWGTALNDDTHPSAVGFTEGADPEEVAEAAAHGH